MILSSYDPNTIRFLFSMSAQVLSRCYSDLDRSRWFRASWAFHFFLDQDRCWTVKLGWVNLVVATVLVVEYKSLLPSSTAP